MKRNVFLTGISALMLIFGLILTGCDNPSGGGGGGTTPTPGGSGATVSSCMVEDNGAVYSIELRCNADFDTDIGLKGIGIGTSDTADAAKGFTVKVNGTTQTINEAYAYKLSSKAYIKFGDGSSLKGNETVTISYDGASGAFAGKLQGFTDKNVPWK
jgi:hypothetical protein